MLSLHWRGCAANRSPIFPSQSVWINCAASADISGASGLLSPPSTVRLFLLQVLHGNAAIVHLRQLSGIDFAAASYCQRGARLPLAVLTSLLGEMARCGGWRSWIGASAGPARADRQRLRLLHRRHAPSRVSTSACRRARSQAWAIRSTSCWGCWTPPAACSCRCWRCRCSRTTCGTCGKCTHRWNRGHSAGRSRLPAT